MTKLGKQLIDGMSTKYQVYSTALEFVPLNDLSSTERQKYGFDNLGDL